LSKANREHGYSTITAFIRFPLSFQTLARTLAYRVISADTSPLATNGADSVATTLATEPIEKSILLIRGHKVLLDVHLAVLYGVTTKRLNEQVRRNRARFPEDFMLQLTAEEAASLRSQSATSNKGRGGRRYAPYAFTEQGVAMLSTVLKQ
jgi:hypothetical protein